MEIFVLSYLEFSWEDSEVIIKGCFNTLEEAIKNIPSNYKELIQDESHFGDHLKEYVINEKGNPIIWHYFIDKVELNKLTNITLY